MSVYAVGTTFLRWIWHSSPPQPQEAKFPDTVLEKYTIVKSIGEGAFGEVFEVTEKKSNGKYALKHIKTEPNTLEAQVKELQLQTNCKSAHVVKIYDHVIWEGHVFSIMELCEGGNLRDWIRRHQRNNMIKEVVILHMLLDVCSAVHSCHSNDIIHRDLKPENILLDDNGCVKLADFGVAKQLDRQSNQRVNTFCGTYPYMAPELYQIILNGTEADGYDHSCDVWSLGCVLFDMATHSNKFICDIKETGRGLGLTVCQQGPSVIASLIATHIPADFKLTQRLLTSMLIAGPKERTSLVDILIDRELQKAVQNPQDGHWYE
ncbi:serine/threonine-protein kinase Nek3-like [Dysidea avara]|uniref:serine/threonine-protein kinase Nek3-like n=1 Tax=Dysidea avara TaxID=196820 RepID=UPI00331BB6E9